MKIKKKILTKISRSNTNYSSRSERTKRRRLKLKKQRWLRTQRPINQQAFHWESTIYSS
jgi:hypothetical protein